MQTSNCRPYPNGDDGVTWVLEAHDAGDTSCDDVCTDFGTECDGSWDLFSFSNEQCLREILDVLGVDCDQYVGGNNMYYPAIDRIGLIGTQFDHTIEESLLIECYYPTGASASGTFRCARQSRNAIDRICPCKSRDPPKAPPPPFPPNLAPLPPPPSPPKFDNPGWLEIWVSRSAALYGTRAATINPDMSTNEITVRLTEGHEKVADGRYVYLRSFASGQRLRIDGLKLFSLPASTPLGAARQLQEEDEFEVHDVPEESNSESFSSFPGKTGADSTKKPVDKSDRFSWTRVWVMRNLTENVCEHSATHPVEAREARVAAAQLWAELEAYESTIGCTNCTSRQPTDCAQWFMQLHGLGFEQIRDNARAKHEQRKRRILEEFEAGSEERLKILGKALGDSCCKLNLKTGQKECGKQHCKRAFQSRAQARMAHTLRTMHEREGPTSLSVVQLVATDFLAPHLHSDERCKDEQKRHAHGDMECLALSLTNHIAKKHGLDQETIDSKLSAYGTSIASMLTSHLKQQGVSGTSQFRKNGQTKKQNVFSDTDARPRRRAEEEKTSPTPTKTRGPRGGWIKPPTSDQDRRLDESDDFVRIGIEPTGRTHLAQRQIDQVVRNHSLHAKQILRKANLGAANSGSRPLTAGTIFTAAWDASISTDSSIFGRSRSVLAGIAHVAERVDNFRREYHRVQQDVLQSPNGAWTGRRKLMIHENAAYDQVDSRVGRTDIGWGPPESHTAKWGWITESVDWVAHYTEAKRVVGILSERTEARVIHVEDTGTLPAGELRDEHKTGWAMLDLNSPPSWLGETLRGMLPHTVSSGRRRLGENYGRRLREVPRAGLDNLDDGAARSVLGSFLDASIQGNDPFLAARHVLQRRDHRSRMRRLGDGFLGGASHALPITQAESVSGLPRDVEWTEAVRYAIFDTALCYLYNQPGGPGGVSTQQNTGYGSTIHTHYSSHMCFPATPYVVPRMATFGETMDISNDFDWDTLEYEELCDSSAVRALIEPVANDITAIGFLMAPYGSLLRIAEGIDAIRNLAGTSLGSNYTELDRAASVVCGFAQFGGVLWLAITLVFLSVFASCAGLWGMFCLRGVRWCRGGQRQMQDYEDAVHEVLLSNISSGRLVDPVGLQQQLRFRGSVGKRQRLRERRMRESITTVSGAPLMTQKGHVLLPQEP